MMNNGDSSHENHIACGFDVTDTGARIGYDFCGCQEGCARRLLHLRPELRGELQHHGLVFAYGLYGWKMD